MAPVKRISLRRSCALIIDVQPFFLSQVDNRLCGRLLANFANFVRLLGHYNIPIMVTLERPVEHKGALPPEIGLHLPDSAVTLEKDSFDLCKDQTIRGRLARQKRKQVLVGGCETDVCVLQSCLGLLHLGYEVFVVEELVFSSARNVEAAVTRLEAEGAIFLSYKTLYYELLETVNGPFSAKAGLAAAGPLPDDLPDTAI